jgi:hypothetical protein
MYYFVWWDEDETKAKRGPPPKLYIRLLLQTQGRTGSCWLDNPNCPQCRGILYLRAILRDVGYAKTVPTNIYEDNFTYKVMSTNPVHRKSSHHIGILLHFCRDLYTDGVMWLIPLQTHLMVADTLTKSSWSCSYSVLWDHVRPYSFLRSSSSLVLICLLLVSGENPSKYGGEWLIPP